jgi:hypothetical protein
MFRSYDHLQVDIYTLEINPTDNANPATSISYTQQDADTQYKDYYLCSFYDFILHFA